MCKFNYICVKIFTLIFALVFFISCQSTVRFSNNAANKKCDVPEYSTHNNSSEKHYSSNSLRNNLVISANDWLGTPYQWGGESKSGADCSGFVQSVYSENNIKIPRTSSQQYSASKKISILNVQPGDLVFFSNGSRINHVGIYIGNSTMIHSSSTYGGIRQSINDDYYQKRLAGFGNIIDDDLSKVQR